MNAPGRASVAYLIVPADEHGNLTFAVEITGVRFDGARILEPGGDPEIRGYSMERVHHAIAERTFNEQLGWFSNFSKGGKR